VRASEPAAPRSTPWSYSASVGWFFIPNGRNYLQPTATADRGRLHLEVRYNNEALDTGSAWIGYNLHARGEVSLAFTPIAAVVLGELNGVAPGYEAVLSWRKWLLYSEGEFIIDFGDADLSYFYTWTTLGVSPWDWMQVGAVLQRTLAYESPRDLQPGGFLGWVHGQASVIGYLFYPKDDDPGAMLSVGTVF
jgi:hypothetical protein